MGVKGPKVDSSCLCLLKQGLSPNPVLTALAVLLGQLLRMPCLSPKCWDYRRAVMPSKHLCGVWKSKLESSYSTGKHLSTEPLPGLISMFLKLCPDTSLEGDPVR